MDYKLSDKTALVTGSTAGIGFAIAQLLAEEGATVAINGRSEKRVTEAMNKIKSVCPSAKLIPAPADLSDQKGCDAIFQYVPTTDILVNNFGIYEVKFFNDISDNDWLRFFEANVMSGIRLSRHYLPHMLENDWGRIVFISSESGLQIPIEMIHYGMTKTAQIAVARGLAETTVGTNVTVNSVLPGPTSSEGVNDFIKNLAKEQNKKPEEIEKELFTSVRPTSLLKRFATPNEVAVMVAYICSPLSSATNGAALRVDGGVVRAIA
ncbi:SDR family NAD(P)-dependent oxidoreductase [Legionella cardiaca]|uniref:SDR family NAD(P)-dependent oxidoreductase n=1 Tax=Legionella cardiaca TaxID=1071983 RepID=A0ABY8AUQ2_9GAMM|nr:SDR family NAD(P)-dependent oxidoreductase [Legionella cardiaca]WED44430.1 SDR family NAD(P)-dependent oxidoreductase [Legionella cardiaca]